LEKEGIEKTVPGQLNLEQGLNVYYKYYTEESVKDSGVVAIKLELIK
jgi:ASC-1-like (ASCH) protein